MRERSRPARARRSALVFLLITVLVNAALFIAPLTEPPGTVDFGEDGGANIIDKGDVTSRINPIARPIYVFGDATCHQKASRSFFINGNQMPVCSRDVGVYLGLTLGALVYLLFPRRFSFLWLFVLIVPLALDGLVQLLTPYESNNAVRLVTGLMYGGVVSMLIVQIMYEIHEVPLRRFGPEVHIERALGIVRPRPRDIHRPGEGDGLDAA
ncbi:MAG TPA: DUF2085 domain-containing protein, partial [Thermoplasmata archaeon]|nr:DUF2085 domain-containing protein [Thermoplasmata archaeon]